MTHPQLKRSFSFVVLPALLAVVLAGCARKQEATPEATGGGHAADGAHHAHVAPHGGTLIEVGEHQFTLELVHDGAEGRLTAYVLDAHAEKFVRLPIQGFAIIALVNGRRESLPMAAVANTMTGETVGDTSEFTATAEWLKGRVAFDAYIPALDIRGNTYTEVRFAFRSSGGQ